MLHRLRGESAMRLSICFRRIASSCRVLHLQPTRSSHPADTVRPMPTTPRSSGVSERCLGDAEDTEKLLDAKELATLPQRTWHLGFRDSAAV